MSNVPEEEDEKNKKDKKTSEANSYDYFGNEGMESVEESSVRGELSLSESGVPPSAFPTVSGISVYESENSTKGKGSTGSCEEHKKERLLKEKWLSVAGRKPKNVPTVRKFRTEEEEFEKIVLFGDRRPMEVERQRKEKWMKAAVIQRSESSDNNLGKVRTEVRLPSAAEGVTCIRYEHNGSSLSTAYRRGGVQVREPFTGEIISSLKTLELNEKLPVRALRYHPLDKHKLYLAGGSGVVQVFDTDSSKLLGTTEKIEQVNNLDISANGYFFVTAGRGGKVCVFDANTLQMVSLRQRLKIGETTTSVIEDEYHKSRIYGLKCHPHETNVFVTGGWDRTVKIWDVRVSGAIHSIRGPFISGSGLDIQNHKLLMACWTVEESLKIWDFPSRRLLDTISVRTKSTIYEGEFLYTGCFLNQNTRGNTRTNSLVAVGGSGFNEACVIDLNTKNIIASFPTYKAVVTLDTLGNILAYGGKESLFRIGEVVISPNAENTN